MRDRSSEASSASSNWRAAGGRGEPAPCDCWAPEGKRRRYAVTSRVRPPRRPHVTGEATMTRGRGGGPHPCLATPADRRDDVLPCAAVVKDARPRMPSAGRVVDDADVRWWNHECTVTSGRSAQQGLTETTIARVAKRRPRPVHLQEAVGGEVAHDTACAAAAGMRSRGSDPSAPITSREAGGRSGRRRPAPAAASPNSTQVLRSDNGREHGSAPPSRSPGRSTRNRSIMRRLGQSVDEAEQAAAGHTRRRCRPRAYR